MSKILRCVAVAVGTFSMVACGYAEKPKGGKDSKPAADESQIYGLGSDGSTGPKGTGETEQCSGSIDCTGTIVVSGTIVHKRGVPHTNDNDFVFTADSHAIVRLYFAEGADAPSETIKEIRFSNLTELPLVFGIPGDPALIFQRQGDYGIQVEVHSGGGDKSRVGDLINEMHYGISGQTTGLTVEVTGLEACDNKGVGGFCIGSDKLTLTSIAGHMF